MIANVRVPNSASSEDVIHYLRKCDANKIYSNFGPLNDLLIRRIRTEVLDEKYHITTHSNGTQALITAIIALAGRPSTSKNLCLVSSYTFIATVSALEQCGFEPFFIDVEEESLIMNLNQYEADIPWSKVGLILPTCPYGIIGNIQELISIGKERNIPVVVDGAATFDTIPNDLDLGAGSLFCISTHATKSFNTGEGGLVLSRSAELSERVRATSNFGMVSTRKSAFHGTNSKLSEYHAAVGLANLDLWSKHQEQLKEINELYLSSFSAYGIDLYNSVFTNCSLAYMIFKCEKADSLISHLEEQQVQFRRWYEAGLHNLPRYESALRTDMNVTELVAQQVIGLPHHIFLTKEYIEFITKSVSIADRI